MSRAVLGLLAIVSCLLLIGQGCKAKRGSSGKSDPDRPAAGTSERPPTPVTDDCPECAGRGLTPYTGENRPCFLCDGDGQCPRCEGDGRTEQGLCAGCDGTGDCADCGGDAVISARDRDGGARHGPLPGLCPVCRDGLGLCPGCGGGGRLDGGEECAVCSGAGPCPECRGSGEDPLSDGSVVCLGCRGHGTVRDGEPGPGWPEFQLIDAEGRAIACRLVEAGGDSIAMARTSRSDAPVETLSVKSVSPLSHYLARLRFLDPLLASDRRMAAGTAARYEALLPIARRDLGLGLDPSSASVPEPRRLTADRALESGLVSAAGEALERGASGRLAWVLLETSLRAFPSGDLAEEATALRNRATALMRSADAGGSPETVERRRQALKSRFDRAVRRAAWWRTRGERLAGRTGADVRGIQRSMRAAREAWLQASFAANDAPSDADRASGRAEAERAASLRAQALVGLAARLLEAGLTERARGLASRALAIRPDDEAARRFMAVVTEALARRALEED